MGSRPRPNDNIDVLFKNKIPMGFSRDRVHVLLSLDTDAMDLSKQPHLVKGGDYPQAWTRELRQGPIVLHVTRDIVTTSGATIRCSELTLLEGSDGP